MSSPVISAWSAVSPFGIGERAFVDGLGSGAPTAVRPAEPDGPFPDDGEHHLVPGFDTRQVLGRKGTRAMDRATALAVATVGELLSDLGEARAVATGPDAAIVLGTTSGSVASQMRLTRDSLTQERPFFVDAARVPNAIMNCPAGQSAIWHRVSGPNTTVAGGRAAGLLALRYSWRLLVADRAKAVLCGAVEEFSGERAWLEHRGRPEGDRDLRLGEGCALLLVEPADTTGRGGDPLAEVLAVETGVHFGADAADRIAECARRALRRGGIGVTDLWGISSVPQDGADGAAERTAVQRLLAGHEPLRMPRECPWGDAGAATAVFQIGAVLTEAARHGDTEGRHVLVLSVDRDGVHAAALLRMGNLS